MLERSAIKVARSVLRGLEVGNDLRLLDVKESVESKKVTNGLKHRATHTKQR